MKGQAAAISLVVISGVAAFIMFISTMDSLNLTRQRYYRDYRFADVFVSLKRAPESVKAQLAAIDGVSLVETRVVTEVKLDIPRFPEPVAARLVSIPDSGYPLLNRLYLRKGRLVDPAKDNEVVVGESFANAHGFQPGDTFGAIINGKWKTLIITGIALSPEFILQIRPEALTPDFKRYGILWMGRKALSSAYDMDGAFNDVVLTLSPRADLNHVVARLDRILDRYGCYGAYGRKDQLSHRLLSDELLQLRRAARIFPAIFMFVAALLLNVVIGRIVGTQREQIAALKAFGYNNVQIAVHYVKMVVAIVLFGVAGGLIGGIFAGMALGDVYLTIYRFPRLLYELQPGVAAAAALISIGAALLGTLHSVWKAAKQPPAETLRPEPPARYRKSNIEKMGIGRRLTQPTKMIIRNIERKPIRSLLTMTGIAVACATIIAGGFFQDSIDYLVNVQLVLSQKEDMTVAFTEPTSFRAVHELTGLKGVTYAETYRMAPARFRFGNRTYKTAIHGLDADSRLHYLLDTKLKPAALPPSGIVLSDYFQKVLGVKAGDLLTVEILEGTKPARRLPVVGFINQYIGLAGYMDRAALNRFMQEGNAVSGAYLTIDSLFKQDLYQTLVKMPRVAGTVVRKDEIRNFYDTQAQAMLFFTYIATLVGIAIAFGVVYNSVRIAFSERSRELSSLRVLGYTRGEISYILLGELGLLTLAAIPAGLLIGRGLCAYMANLFGSDIYRVPMVLEMKTYTLAAAVILVSAMVSGLMVRHKLDHLNLVEVLKTRE